VTRSILALTLFLSLFSSPTFAQAVEYRLLATSKTSTMERELNEAGALGFRFVAVMGGETAGGDEVVVMVQRGGDIQGRYRYRLLATNRTETLEKELNEAARDGFDYVGQSIFKSVFGGQEVVAIVEGGSAVRSDFSYKLLATSQTSTMQRELAEAGRAGYQALGMTVGNTAFGGDEILVVVRRKIAP